MHYSKKWLKPMGLLLGISLLIAVGYRQAVSATYPASDFPIDFLQQATPEPFLYSPYYGEAAVSSITVY